MKHCPILLVLVFSMPLSLVNGYGYPPQPQPYRPNPPYPGQGPPPQSDPRGRPQGGPPNSYQGQGNRPPYPPNQYQGGPPPGPPGQGQPPRPGYPGQGPGQQPPYGPPQPPRNSQVDSIGAFLRTEEGQKDLAEAVDREAGVIAQEMIEVLQEDAVREDISKGVGVPGQKFSRSVLILSTLVLFFICSYFMSI